MWEAIGVFLVVVLLTIFIAQMIAPDEDRWEIVTHSQWGRHSETCPWGLNLLRIGMWNREGKYLLTFDILGIVTVISYTHTRN